MASQISVTEALAVSRFRPLGPCFLKPLLHKTVEMVTIPPTLCQPTSVLITMVIVFDVIAKGMNWKNMSLPASTYGMAELQKLRSCTFHI